MYGCSLAMGSLELPHSGFCLLKIASLLQQCGLQLTSLDIKLLQKSRD